ncbi:MAG: hypothetical protein SO010_12500, partial [Candidatus Limiplasma sp.]|nr:hypothetical protein [Candidatus Limiplasma sp.]
KNIPKTIFPIDNLPHRVYDTSIKPLRKSSNRQDGLAKGAASSGTAAQQKAANGLPRAAAKAAGP